MKRAVIAALAALSFFLLPIFPQSRPGSIKPQHNLWEQLSTTKALISGGQYVQAQKLLLQSLKVARKPEEKKEIIFYLAETNASLGQLDEAVERYLQCLELAKQIKDPVKISYCQKTLTAIDLFIKAKDLRQNKNHDEAIRILNEAITICDEIKNETIKIKCLRRKSLSLLDLNDQEAYLKLNLEASAIAKRLKNPGEIIKLLINIGHWYFSNNNLNLAIDYFSQAALYINEDTLPQDAFDVYYNLGTVYNEIGNFSKAIEYFSAALNRISGDKDNPYYSATLIGLGFSYVKKGLNTGTREDYNRAFEYFIQAQMEASKTNYKNFEIITLNNLGSLKAHLEEDLDALYYLNKARILAEELKLNSYLVSIYTNIGIIYARLGDYQNSILYYDKAINLALAENENRTLWESYLEKANLLRKQGLPEEARFYYLNSINIIESLRSKLLTEEDKASFFGSDKRLDAYHNLVDLLVNQAGPSGRTKLAQAFNYMERAKARAFLESIEAAKVSQEFPVDIRLANKEKELMSDLSRIYTRLITPEIEEKERSRLLDQIKLIEEELERVRREIRLKNPAFANLTYPETISYDRARKEFIDGRTAIFAFLVGKESAYAFCLSSKGLKVYSIPAQKELREMVSRHRRAISDTDNQDFSSGNELYRALIEPGLENGLKNSLKKLLIIPDDILTVLPFETLVLAEPADWLIKHYTISYAPSLSSLKELVHKQNRKNRKKPSNNLLAVGDPYYGELEEKYTELSTKTIFQDLYSLSDMKFYRLRYSQEEVHRITNQIPRSMVLTREKASEDLIKRANLADYRILHFAAHGLIDDQKPARSAIVLTLDNDPAEDGFLQIREILNLKLNSDLVVLSSCQTGLGQFIRGEGIEGLSRAFFYAGASSVLISLWTVNDQVASQLMERFYLHLKAAQNPAEALRAVKLEMVDSGVVSHPYYWAPFILNGDGDLRIFAPGYPTPLALGLSLLGLTAGVLIFRKKFFNNRKNH
ncbi:MAG: CHAT domain-containing protein [Candidatus Saccharicenans sp.]|uniref:CHAT domain-containing protein n=1 Tax=Candidatus Saccharicenans sp. TaxID=2819258 RepID=UPI004048FFE6